MDRLTVYRAFAIAEAMAAITTGVVWPHGLVFAAPWAVFAIVTLYCLISSEKEIKRLNMAIRMMSVRVRRKGSPSLRVAGKVDDGYSPPSFQAITNPTPTGPTVEGTREMGNGF